jgi:altronate dehydratase
MTTSNPSNPSNPVIVISAGDNVATALEPLEPGRVFTGGDARVTVRDAIPRGHKVALARIAPGAAVIKYGSSIGVATDEILPGAHVHTHNVSSARGRGDLAAARQQPAAAGRLAEPDGREP